MTTYSTVTVEERYEMLWHIYLVEDRQILFIVTTTYDNEWGVVHMWYLDCLSWALLEGWSGSAAEVKHWVSDFHFYYQYSFFYVYLNYTKIWQFPQNFYNNFERNFANLFIKWKEL